MIKTYTPSDRFGSNMYLVSDHASSVLIDPSTPPSVVCADFPGGLPHLDAIFLTHAHFDHMLGIDEWVRQTGAPVYVGKEDADALSDPGKNAYRLFSGEERGYTGAYHPVEDGQILCFPSFRVEVMATPGHTPGSVSYRIGDAAFTGDLLFDGGGYGRCDLPGGNLSALFSSVRRLAGRTDIRMLYPGHGTSFSPRHLAAQFQP